MNTNNKVVIIVGKKKFLDSRTIKYYFGLLAGTRNSNGLAINRSKIFKRYYISVYNNSNDIPADATSVQKKYNRKLQIFAIDIKKIKRDNIIFYKHITNQICYNLISFPNYAKKKNYNTYRRFFHNIYKILFRFSNKQQAKRKNKRITKLSVLNTVSYNFFILNIVKEFNNTLEKINTNNYSSNINDKQKRKLNKEIYKEFHLFVKNQFITIINNSLNIL